MKNGYIIIHINGPYKGEPLTDRDGQYAVYAEEHQAQTVLDEADLPADVFRIFPVTLSW